MAYRSDYHSRMADLFTRRGDIEGQSALNKGQLFTQLARIPEQTMSMLWQLDDRKRQIARDEENQQYMKSLRTNQERATQRLDRIENRDAAWTAAINTPEFQQEDGYVDVTLLGDHLRQNFPEIDFTSDVMEFGNTQTAHQLNAERQEALDRTEGVAGLLQAATNILGLPDDKIVDGYSTVQGNFNRGLAELGIPEDLFLRDLAAMQSDSDETGRPLSALMGDAFKAVVSSVMPVQDQLTRSIELIDEVNDVLSWEDTDPRFLTEGPGVIAGIVTNIGGNDWADINNPTQAELDATKEKMMGMGMFRHRGGKLSSLFALGGEMGVFTASGEDQAPWSSRLLGNTEILYPGTGSFQDQHRLVQAVRENRPDIDVTQPGWWNKVPSSVVTAIYDADARPGGRSDSSAGRASPTQIDQVREMPRLGNEMTDIGGGNKVNTYLNYRDEPTSQRALSGILGVSWNPDGTVVTTEDGRPQVSNSNFLADWQRAGVNKIFSGYGGAERSLQSVAEGDLTPEMKQFEIMLKTGKALEAMNYLREEAGTDLVPGEMLGEATARSNHTRQNLDMPTIAGEKEAVDFITTDAVLNGLGQDDESFSDNLNELWSEYVGAHQDDVFEAGFSSNPNDLIRALTTGPDDRSETFKGFQEWVNDSDARVEKLRDPLTSFMNYGNVGWDLKDSVLDRDTYDAMRNNRNLPEFAGRGAHNYDGWTQLMDDLGPEDYKKSITSLLTPIVEGDNTDGIFEMWQEHVFKIGQ